MASKRSLTDEQAHEIEEQLFSTNRLQIDRKLPVPLPRPDFWEMIRKLLSDLDLEIQNMMRNGRRDMRLQNRQRKQSNIRRIASDVARRRMVAMMRYVASQSLRSVELSDGDQTLPAIDWQRHDPAEKAIFLAMQNEVDRFKKEIDWLSIQQGIEGEIHNEPAPVARGTMQLDAFMNEGEQLTNRPPPTLAFEDTQPTEIEYDLDEEERILSEPEWPELTEYDTVQLEHSESAPPVQQENTQAIAPELVPSKKKKQAASKHDSTEDQNLLRIRIIESSDEAIVDGEGNEIELHIGDVHMLDHETAQLLIDVGLAENASL